MSNNKSFARPIISLEGSDNREGIDHLIREFGVENVKICLCGIAHPAEGEIVEIPDALQTADDEERVIPTGSYRVTASFTGTSSHFIALENLDIGGEEIECVVGHTGGLSVDWRNCKKGRLEPPSTKRTE